MNPIKRFCFTLLLTPLIVFEAYAQSDNIRADSKPFQYLIGKEYVKFDEFEDFKLLTKSMIKNQKGESKSVTTWIKGDKQIITSEKSRIDENTNEQVYTILDVEVLNGKYTLHIGAFLPRKKGNEVLSFHPPGRNDASSVLLALEKSHKTGKFKQVNPAKLKRASED